MVQECRCPDKIVRQRPHGRRPQGTEPRIVAFHGLRFEMVLVQGVPGTHRVRDEDLGGNAGKTHVESSSESQSLQDQSGLATGSR